MPVIYFTVLVSGQQYSSLNLPETYGLRISFMVFGKVTFFPKSCTRESWVGCCHLPEAVSISNDIYKNTCQQLAPLQSEYSQPQGASFLFWGLTALSRGRKRFWSIWLHRKPLA